MATIYYLNWDQTADHDAASDFFSQLHVGGGDELATVPKDWYRELTTVPDLPETTLWTAFQADASLDPTDDELRTARHAFQQTHERSMSIGDVIGFADDTLRLAVSFGFTDVTWGGEPDLDMQLSDTE